MNDSQEEKDSNFENEILIPDFTPLDISEVEQRKATAESVEFISCFMKVTVSDQVQPFPRTTGVAKQVVISVASDYEILQSIMKPLFPQVSQSRNILSRNIPGPFM